MASVLQTTRAAQQLLGQNCTVKFEEKLEDRYDGYKVVIALRARAVRHPQGNPHRALETIDGAWVDIPVDAAVSPKDYDMGRSLRGLIEDRALDLLSDAIASKKTATELERARALVAAADAAAAPPPAAEPEPAPAPKSKKS